MNLFPKLDALEQESADEICSSQRSIIGSSPLPTISLGGAWCQSGPDRHVSNRYSNDNGPAVQITALYTFSNLVVFCPCSWLFIKRRDLLILMTGSEPEESAAL